MAQMDLPLPEITKKDFLRAWTRFQLVAAAKEWRNAAKQATVLSSTPDVISWQTIVDILSTRLDDDTRADLTSLKKALMSKAGLIKDSLVAGIEFIARMQQEGKTVSMFAGDLLKVAV